jgi:hypothetical protein
MGVAFVVVVACITTVTDDARIIARAPRRPIVATTHAHAHAHAHDLAASASQCHASDD